MHDFIMLIRNIFLITVLEADKSNCLENNKEKKCKNFLSFL